MIKMLKFSYCWRQGFLIKTFLFCYFSVKLLKVNRNFNSLNNVINSNKDDIIGKHFTKSFQTFLFSQYISLASFETDWFVEVSGIKKTQHGQCYKCVLWKYTKLVFFFIWSGHVIKFVYFRKTSGCQQQHGIPKWHCEKQWSQSEM